MKIKSTENIIRYFHGQIETFKRQEPQVKLYNKTVRESISKYVKLFHFEAIEN